jgi:hypothetical protein
MSDPSRNLYRQVTCAPVGLADEVGEDEGTILPIEVTDIGTF